MASRAPSPETAHARWPWLLAAALCIAADLAFLGDALFTERVRAPADILARLQPFRSESTDPVPPPHNPLLGDWPLQFHPWHRLVRGSWMEGRAPLWNEMSAAGAPLLANLQCEAVSPYLPLLLLGDEQYPDLRQFAALILAQISCLILARHLGISPPAGILAALAFSFSSPLQVWAVHPHLGVMAFAPWTLWAFLRLREEVSLRRVAVAAIPIGLAVLAGHVEYAFLSAFGGCAVAALRCPPSRRPLRDLLRFLVAVPGAGVLGIALAAIVILPFFDYLGQSAVEEIRLLQPEPPTSAQHAMSLLDPQALGHHLDAANPYRGAGNYIETTVFLGRIALLLAVIGAALGMIRRRPTVLPLIAVVTLGCVMSYAPPALREILDRLPPFDRTPLHRTVFISMLPLALLAGIGLDGLTRTRRGAVNAHLAPPLAAGVLLILAALWGPDLLPELASGARARVGWPSIGIFAAAALGLAALVASRARPRARRALVGLVLAAVFAESWHCWHDFVPVCEVSSLSPRSQLLDPVRAERRGFRLLPAGGVLPPETQILAGVSSIRSYDAIGLRRHLHLLAWTRDFSPRLLSCVAANDRVLDLLSVRWVLSPWPPESSPRVLSTLDLRAGTPFAVPRRLVDAPVELIVLAPDGAPRRGDRMLISLSDPEGRALRWASDTGIGPKQPLLGEWEMTPDGAITDLLKVHHRDRRAHYLVFTPPTTAADVDLRCEVEGTGVWRLLLVVRGGFGAEARTLAERRGMYLGERPSALPRAYVAPPVRICDSLEDAVASLGDARVPHALTLIEGVDPRDLPPADTAPSAPRALPVEQPRPEELRIRLDLEAPACVVVTDAHARGWEAEIDGEPAPIFPANVVGRAVIVPAGRHLLRMVYRPRAFTLGVALSAIAALACCALLLWRRRPCNESAEAPPPEPEDAARRDR